MDLHADYLLRVFKLAISSHEQVNVFTVYRSYFCFQGNVMVLPSDVEWKMSVVYNAIIAGNFSCSWLGNLLKQSSCGVQTETGRGGFR